MKNVQGKMPKMSYKEEQQKNVAKKQQIAFRQNRQNKKLAWQEKTD